MSTQVAQQLAQPSTKKSVSLKLGLNTQITESISGYPYHHSLWFGDTRISGTSTLEGKSTDKKRGWARSATKRFIKKHEQHMKYRAGLIEDISESLYSLDSNLEEFENKVGEIADIILNEDKSLPWGSRHIGGVKNIQVSGYGNPQKSGYMEIYIHLNSKTNKAGQRFAPNFYMCSTRQQKIIHNKQKVEKWLMDGIEKGKQRRINQIRKLEEQVASHKRHIEVGEQALKEITK